MRNGGADLWRELQRALGLREHPWHFMTCEGLLVEQLEDGAALTLAIVDHERSLWIARLAVVEGLRIAKLIFGDASAEFAAAFIEGQTLHVSQAAQLFPLQAEGFSYCPSMLAFMRAERAPEHVVQAVDRKLWPYVDVRAN